MHQNDSEQQNTHTWNRAFSWGFPKCAKTTVSEARNALSVLLRFMETNRGECDIKCITSFVLIVKNISSLTSKQAVKTDFLPNPNLCLCECECEQCC